MLHKNVYSCLCYCVNDMVQTYETVREIHATLCRCVWSLQLAGVRIGDFIVSVGDMDVKWSRHVRVVAMIRDAGLTVRLGLVTPLDRSFVDSDITSNSSCDLESNSVSSLRLQSDVQVHAVMDVSGHTTTPTLSRHWGFRCRRKREKHS